jgi:hypothetical protein
LHVPPSSEEDYLVLGRFSRLQIGDASVHRPVYVNTGAGDDQRQQQQWAYQLGTETQPLVLGNCL